MKNLSLYRSATFLLIAIGIFSCQGTATENAQTEFFVRGNCGMCKERIETAVMKVEGVKAADWNVESKLLNVSYDSTRTDEKTLNQAVAKVGHETKLVISPKEVHDQLPACCKKTSM